MSPIISTLANASARGYRSFAAALVSYIAVSHTGGSNVSAYPWLPGFGTKYANPATLPSNNGYGVAFI